MSGINGDKSRHHRMRKQKIQRRMRNRALETQAVSAAKPTAPVTARKRKDAAHE